MQNVIQIINIILLIGVLQGFIFTIVMFKTKTNNKAILYLSLIVFFLSLNNLQAWLVEKDLIQINYYIDYLHVSWNIFLAPMFYLFLINYLKVKQQLKHVFIITVSLFILTIIIRLISLNYIATKFKTEQFYSFLRSHNAFEDIFVFLFTVPIFVFSVYIFLKQKNKFTEILMYHNLKWLKTFLRLCSIILFFWLIAIYLNYKFTNISSSHFYMPLRLGTSFLIYWLGYQGFNQQKLMENRIQLRESIKKEEKKLIENNNSNSNEIELQKFNELRQFIKENQSFLNPYLSLSSLAEELKTNTNDLSKIINRNSVYNFTDFINSFRVNYAIDILENPKFKLYTIIAIGLESGFNSKSAFYNAFKKFTQFTPSQYRKRQK